MKRKKERVYSHNMKIFKQELYIILISAAVVLAAAFLVMNSSFNLTGFFILDNNETNSSVQVFPALEITREDALLAINESLKIMLDMATDNFSIVYINDTLVEAKMVFKQAEYAEILRNSSISPAKQAEARSALNLVDWKNISYASVIKYTDEIKLRRERALLIYDSLAALDFSLSNYESRGIELLEARDLFLNATLAFNEERYEEAESFMEKTRASIDASGAEASVLADLKRGLVGFIQQYWIYIIAFFIFLVIVIYFSYESIKKFMLKKRIVKMEAQQKALDNMMKKAQIERFKENKISGLVYNIRMRSYQEKLNKLKEELPVLEERLKRFK